MPNREHDRIHFPDPEFNAWLDEPMAHNELTVWHATQNVASAWSAWCARPSYTYAPTPTRVRAIGRKEPLEIDRIETDGDVEVVYVMPANDDRAQAEIDILRARLTHARAIHTRAINILAGIHSFIQPEPIAHAGKTYEFVPPGDLLLTTWRELSRRIRDLPEQLAKVA